MSTYAQDWKDDAERFSGSGAFITVTGDDGEYTDFDLNASELAVVFKALAEHAEHPVEITREVTATIRVPMMSTDAVDIAVHDFFETRGIHAADVTW